MFRSRIFALIGAAVLSIVIGTSAESSSPAVVSSAGAGCQGMNRVEASKTFRHLDGSPSALSEWIPQMEVLIHKGPIVRGKMPFGFYAVGKFLIANRYYTLGGAKLIGRRFQIWCASSRSFVEKPPSDCPQTAQASWRNLGGRKLKWQEGAVEPFSGVRSVVGYFVTNPRNFLGWFTVPHQGIVTRYKNDGQFEEYFPGERVPSWGMLGITCYY